MEWLILNVLFIGIVFWIWMQEPEPRTDLCSNSGCSRPLEHENEQFCSQECAVYVDVQQMSEDELTTRQLFRQNKDKLGF